MTDSSTSEAPNWDCEGLHQVHVRAEAEVWHNETKAQWTSGSQGAAKGQHEEKTFGDCLNDYLSDSEGFGRLRLSSQQSMEARLDHFLKSPVVSVRMNDFGAGTVDAWFDWILQQPTAEAKGRKSFRIELKYLGIVLNWYRNERNSTFVVPVVRRHRKRAIFKEVKPRRKDYFIRPDDIGPWIQWLKSHRKDPVYHRLAMFMVLTGTRLGEAVGLCWDKVDLKQNEVHITRTMSWDHWSRQPYLVEAVKTKDSDRIIPLSDSLAKLMSGMRGESVGRVPVFRTLRGEYLRDNAVRSAFNAGFKALDLPWNATHICRHTWGTIGLKANGDNISKVQTNMGHSDRRMTELYAKAVAQADRSTVENTAKLMGFSG